MDRLIFIIRVTIIALVLVYAGLLFIDLFNYTP